MLTYCTHAWINVCKYAFFLTWTCCPSRSVYVRHIQHIRTGLWAEQIAQCNNTKADWVRKGHSLAQMIFWTRLEVFEEPGHPPSCQPAPPVPTLCGTLLFGLKPNRIPMFIWWKFFHSFLSVCLLNLKHYFCLSVLQVSAGKVCVRVWVSVCACRHVCITSLVGVWSKVWPEHITEGQWVSWNSCGRKPSNYAIRSGYNNVLCARVYVVVYVFRTCVYITCVPSSVHWKLWLTQFQMRQWRI